MGLSKRRVKTASGATAIQIVRYRRGGRQVLEHVGSAHDDASVAMLEALAAERIQEMLGGQQLALDVDDPDSSASTSAPVVQGAGTRARVLGEVLNSVYERIGFDAVDSEVFRALVIARLIRPTSKLQSLEVLH